MISVGPNAFCGEVLFLAPNAFQESVEVRDGNILVSFSRQTLGFQEVLFYQVPLYMFLDIQ